MFDVIFIQELSWSILRTIPSSTNCKGDKLVGVPNYPNWVTFSRSYTQPNNSSRVITYINIYLSSLRFSLRNNILQYRDISCVSFFNHRSIYFLINVYSDLSQAALKYTEVEISNILILTDDFNIKDHFWDLNFLYHSHHRETLFKIADLLQLEISKPYEFFTTRYSDDSQISNSVLDLVFLCPGYTKFNNHHIYSNWRLSSDHTSITVNISITEEQVHTKKQSLIKDSEEELLFINKLTHSITNINTASLLYVDNLEAVIQKITYNIKRIWHKYSKIINITKQSKAW